MSKKMLKIIFLISLIMIFFFPFLAFSGIHEQIQAVLEEQGVETLSVSEPNVLLPDQGITFELKKFHRLRPGKNRLEISLFYNGSPYMDTTVDVETAGETKADSPSWNRQSLDHGKTRITNQSMNWIVRKGDKITLLFRKQGLVIKTEGKVLENGRKNDEVRALNRFCDKTVKGLVLDRNNILIQD